MLEDESRYFKTIDLKDDENFKFLSRKAEYDSLL